MAFLFTNTYVKPHFDKGDNYGYDPVLRSIRGLHCTWLVPRTSAFSNGMDDADSGEWIYLKKGVDHRGCGPIGLHGHRIMLYGGVWPPSGESRGARNWGWSQGRPCRCPKSLYPDVLTCDIEVRLFCNRALIWWFAGGYAFGFEIYSLVLRGTQIPYSAAVDLVAGLGYHKWYQNSKLELWLQNTYETPHSDRGVNSGYDLILGSVRGLHCTWLVPGTRASSDGVDNSDSGEWIHLKKGVDRRGCGLIGLRENRIMLCGGVWPPSGESRGA
ncbi:hypothetical protein M9H77_06603 [Catharanthus roseus]|uniref:Uncharacterized protein n=1 Tax=Catharanthus roseus TaxID=4058 RepID=A0ACC0BSJ9_CATRO|nr:hypothetical protein M9H77_06603 [Catharanthus roseus]